MLRSRICYISRTMGNEESPHFSVTVQDEEPISARHIISSAEFVHLLPISIEKAVRRDEEYVASFVYPSNLLENTLSVYPVSAPPVLELSHRLSDEKDDMSISFFSGPSKAAVEDAIALSGKQHTEQVNASISAVLAVEGNSRWPGISIISEPSPWDINGCDLAVKEAELTFSDLMGQTGFFV